MDQVDNRITVRIKGRLRRRIGKVVKVSKRTLSSVVFECLETHLPKMERQHRRNAA